MTTSENGLGEVDATLVPLRGRPVQATFVPRPAGLCTICDHGLPAGSGDTCTTCLTDYGLPMPGVA